MTRDEIIRLAREAGWSGLYIQWAEPTGKPDWSPFQESLTVPVTMDEIKRFADLVAAHEREACAQIADAYADNIGPLEYDCGGSIAAEIRARSNP